MLCPVCHKDERGCEGHSAPAKDELTIGTKVVRKPEYRNAAWHAYCKDNKAHPAGVFTVKGHYSSSVGNFLCLEELPRAPGGWAPDKFDVVTYLNEEVKPVYKVDVVKAPSHYQFFPGCEAIEVIASSMTEEMFKGYCMGNRLKYRLRAGNKDKLEQDIAKSDFYVELYNKHKHLCQRPF